ncbi:MAG: DUF4126 domain-containing protein [Acidimicrobiia bacterium]|nr:DUF4126 domain-containing protein [Acidimicrobiia bacterium]
MTELGLLAGSGWASGINLYAVTVILGLAGRLGWADIPEVLTRTDVLVVAAVLYSIEFVGDKIPYVDNLWDVANTVIRPLGAAALGVVLAGESESIGAALGGLVAGALALSAHSTKATTRAAVNTSPEPFSNSVISIAEDGLASGLTVAAIVAPIPTLIVVAVLVFAGGYVTVKLWGTVRRLLRRNRVRFRTPPADGAG